VPGPRRDALPAAARISSPAPAAPAQAGVPVTHRDELDGGSSSPPLSTATTTTPPAPAPARTSTPSALPGQAPVPTPHASSNPTALSNPTAPSSVAPSSQRPRSGAVRRGEGSIAVLATPWAYVTIDGAEERETPLELSLPAGVHRLRARHPQLGKAAVTVKLAPGQRYVWRPKLSR
jgi:hypothetical protein